MTEETKSDLIRRLAATGIPAAEIARRAGVRYQHAYNVLKKQAAGSRSGVCIQEASPRPILTAEALIRSGFRKAGNWIATPEGEIAVDSPLPAHAGVYAMCVAGIAMYVGVAKMGLARRLYFYAKPGISQTTSIRIKALIRELLAENVVEILVAEPSDFDWNGLPVSGVAGLEIGIIQAFSLPWNKQGAARR